MAPKTPKTNYEGTLEIVEYKYGKKNFEIV